MPRVRKLSPGVRRALGASAVNVPQVGELIAHFMALAGGPRALAKMLMQEFLAAKTGSQIRQRLLDSILRMLAVANAQMGGGLEEIDLVGQADLEAEAARLIGEMPDAEEEPQAEGAGDQGGPVAEAGDADGAALPDRPGDDRAVPGGLSQDGGAQGGPAGGRRRR